MGKAPGDDVSQEMQAVEQEVDRLRERTQSIVSELEARIHARMTQARSTVARLKHAVDVKAQLREHPRAAAGIGASALVAIGIGIWWAVDRSRREQRLVPRMRRKAHALGQLIAEPERYLRRKEPLGRRVLAAVLATTATVLARAIARRLLAGAQRPGRLPALPMAPIPIT